MGTDLLAGFQKIVRGGVSNGLLDLHEGGGQHDCDISLPGLAEALEPVQAGPNCHQLPAPEGKTRTTLKTAAIDIFLPV